MKKKFSSILHILTSQAWGGLELYVVTLVRKMLEQGYKTAIYCLPNSKVEMEAKRLGIPIFYAQKQSKFSIEDILNVKKIMQSNDYSILHTHTRQDVWLASFVKRLLKVKLLHSLYMSAPAKKDFIHKFIYKKINYITSSSEILNEKIKKNYPLPASKVKLLRYGRDIKFFNRNIEETIFVRKLWNTSSEKIVFCTMCRLDSAKGVKEFAESILSLKESVKKKIKIWIMGEPTLLRLNENGEPIYENQSLQLYQWLKEFAKNNKELIEILPFQKNIEPYLQAMDVFVLATYSETYSLSVLDAMGVGLPVIGSCSGGTPEQVLHEKRGYLIEPKSSESIAKAIEYYIENPQKIHEHGQAAREWVTNEHNWKHTLNELNNLYELALIDRN